MTTLTRGLSVGLGLALLAPAVPARAESGTLSVGYSSRIVGMAGAGLAMTDNPTQVAPLNPAAYALRGIGLGIQWPGATAGVSSAALNDALDELEGGSIDSGSAENLAIKLGQENTRLQFQVAPLGIAVSRFGLGTHVNADAFIRPDSMFSRFANSGMGASQFGTWLQGQQEFANAVAAVNAINPTGKTQAQLQAEVEGIVNAQIASQMGADVAGVAAAGASVGFGSHLPGEKLKDISVGVRLKMMRVYYSHWRVQPAVKANAVTASDFTGTQFNDWGSVGVQAKAGGELAGKESYDENAYGVDFGALWQPQSMPWATFAFTIDNLIEPDFTVPAGASAYVPASGKTLMPRTFNVGAAVRAPFGLQLAADLVDITGATDVRPDGKAQFRLGAEWRPPLPVLRYLTVQAGYGSASGPAAGISFCPAGVHIGIAVAKGLPLMASQSFNF